MRWRFPRAGRRGDGELVFDGHRASVWEDEIYPKMAGRESCVTMCVYLMPPNHTPDRDGKYHVICIYLTTIT